MRSFYDILRIDEDSEIDAIKRAYFDYLRKVHPDKQGAECDADAVGQATIIWSTLKDQDRRHEYDLWLREQRLRELKGTVAETIEIDEDETDIDEQCRCGDSYQVTPEQVKQIVDRGLFECASCSLCLELVRV